MIRFNLRGYSELVDANRKELQTALKLTRQRVSAMVGADLEPRISQFVDVLNALGIQSVDEFFLCDGCDGPTREVTLVESAETLGQERCR